MVNFAHENPFSSARFEAFDRSELAFAAERDVRVSALSAAAWESPVLGDLTIKAINFYI